MKTGTKSLLFGVHQFLWHPVTVWLAWRALYGQRPTWRETVCIAVHDLGYWGSSNMDGEEGERHPYFGANLAGRLFGPRYYDLCLYHSRYLSEKLGRQPSKLCWADKFSMGWDPSWLYLPRARWSGELAEYRRNADRRGFIALAAPDIAWHRKLVAHLQVMANEKLAEIRRRDWIDQTSYELAKWHGDSEPNENLRQWAELMAHTYYDEAIEEGCEVSTPEEAVSEEFFAGY